MVNSKRILYISSADPQKGPGAIAMDHFRALKEAGYDVDFLTKYQVKDFPEIKYVLEKPENRYLDRIRRFKYYFLKRFRKPKPDMGPFFYFYSKETVPPVPVKKVLKKISKNYDLIIVYFWQDLLSYETMDKIYNKSGNNPKVYFINADYSTMTGGCHFFCSCRNYETGCGKCPMINSDNPNDFTSWNMNYRKKVIEKIKPYVSVNSYSSQYFKNSILFKNNERFIQGTMILDLDKYKPVPFEDLAKKYNIDYKDKFIILFGCQNFKEERKGMKYLLESLKIFYDNLSSKEKEKVLLLTIGLSNGLEEKLPPFEQKHLGYVSVDDLPKVYSMANVFISPSINDPGPSMVNQSIACGTPVIAFEMGTAIDVIKDKGSGFCLPLKDTKKMSDAILKTFRMSHEEYDNLRQTSRKVAEEYHSYHSFSNKIGKMIKGEI